MSPDSFLVHVAKLRRRLGSREAVQRSVPVSGLCLSSAAVPDNSPVTLDLVLESISEGIVATGELTVAWKGPCRRCLTEVEGTLRVDVREVFEARAVDGDTWPLDGDQVDLEPMVRDNVLLALPLAPLCDDACQGPAPDRFPAVTEESAEAGPVAGREQPTDPPRDPRWAVLDDLDLGG